MANIQLYKLLSLVLLLTLAVSLAAPAASAEAAGIGSVLDAVAAPTAPANGGGILNTLFDLIFNKLLGPVFNIFGGNSSSSGGSPVKVTPLSTGSGPLADNGGLRGKVIVVDPGHGGNNPGAVANGVHEADINLGVGLKLRDRLRQAGATVIMTRDTDRNVAPGASSLGEELQARIDMIESNHADIFVSVHSNENPDPSIAGAMTFYPSGKSSALAREVQSALVRETSAVDKGTEPATFYVLRNATVPAILVEMGFVSNAGEAAKLNSDAYCNKVAQGVFNGIAKYFQNK